MLFLSPLLPDQRLDLCKLNPSDSDAVRGQIVGKAGTNYSHGLSPRVIFLSLCAYSALPLCHTGISLTFTNCLLPVSLQTRDRIGSGGPVVDCRGLLENDGWVRHHTFPLPTSCRETMTYCHVVECFKYVSCIAFSVVRFRERMMESHCLVFIIGAFLNKTIAILTFQTVENKTKTLNVSLKCGKYLNTLVVIFMIDLTPFLQKVFWHLAKRCGDCKVHTIHIIFVLMKPFSDPHVLYGQTCICYVSLYLFRLQVLSVIHSYDSAQALYCVGTPCEPALRPILDACCVATSVQS